VRLTSFIFALLVACTCFSQGTVEIRRCDCPPLDDYWCLLYPEACQACWDDCPGIEFRKPLGPTRDPWLVTYRLPKTVGVSYLHGRYHVAGPDRTLTAHDVAYEVATNGIRALYLWIDVHPLDGLGQPFCYDLWDTGEENWWCEYDTVKWESCEYTTEPSFEDMIHFWQSVPLEVIFVRFRHWHVTDSGGCEWITNPPVYEVAKELYRIAHWRDTVIIIGDWENDNQLFGCGTNPSGALPDMNNWYNWDGCQDGETEHECRSRAVDMRAEHLLAVTEQRQKDIERARKEAYLEHGGSPNLRILHAVILSRFPGNTRDHEQGIPRFAERLHQLERSPDLLGISYYVSENNASVEETLDWVKETTGYPKQRMFIAEVGATEDRQQEVLTSRISAFRDWGIKLVFAWVWKLNWCEDENHQFGLITRQDVCTSDDDVPVFGPPAPGFDVIRQFNVVR